MKYIYIVLCLFVTSCVSNRVSLTPQDTELKCSMSPQEIEELLTRDATNKHWQRMYLAEIDSAIRHNDMVSIGFFVNEYTKVPKEIVPLWLRQHPLYVQPVSQLEKHFRITIFSPAKR